MPVLERPLFTVTDGGKSYYAARLVLRATGGTSAYTLHFVATSTRDAPTRRDLFLAELAALPEDVTAGQLIVALDAAARATAVTFGDWGLPLAADLVRAESWHPGREVVDDQAEAEDEAEDSDK